MSFPLELEALPNLAKLGAFTDNQTYSKAQTHGALNENEGNKNRLMVYQLGEGEGVDDFEDNQQKHMLMRIFC